MTAWSAQAAVEPLDRILGLEMGADDYLPKPFDPRELRARVTALLRLVQREGDRNPTSGLPGGHAIEEELERKILWLSSWTIHNANHVRANTDGLDAAGVAWTRMSKLVRGLDYYCHTAFEFTTDALRNQLNHLPSRRCTRSIVHGRWAAHGSS